MRPQKILPLERYRLPQNSECISSSSAELVSDARRILDPDSSTSGSSSAFGKLRQPDGCVEAAQQHSGNTGTESLPSGWEQRKDPRGRTYYADHNTQTTT